MRLELAPVAFVALAHPRAGACQQGVLTFRSEPGDDPAYELTAEAATGRLKVCALTQRRNDLRLVLRPEAGAYTQVYARVGCRQQRVQECARCTAPLEQFAGAART